ASQPSVEMLETLTKLDETLASCSDVDEFERVAREFRRVVTIAAAGPHLRALLRSFSGLVPAAARFSIVAAMDSERAALGAEFEALRAGDPDAAATATLDHIALTADNAIRALRARGIVDGAGGSPGDSAGEAALVKRVLERGGRP